MTEYTVVETERRTLEIGVLPDGQVVVRAPIGCPPELIETKVKKRSRWIQTQQRFFGQFRPRMPARQYLSGETHLYLGKRYRLKIAVGPKPSVRLVGTHFVVEDSPVPDPNRVATLMDRWYRIKAETLFEQVLERLWSSHRWAEHPSPPTIRLRRMTTHWGSLSSSGTLSINPGLVQTPLECIEYVLCHELCHLVHHDHGADFFRLLDARMPDWKKRKHKLELSLI